MKVWNVKNKRNPYKSAVVANIAFTIGVEATNAINVNVLAKDLNGKAITVRAQLDWYLAGDANGDTIAAAASGGVAGGTDGALLATVTGRMGKLTTEPTGSADLVITDVTARTVYLVIVLPDGSLKVSGAITFA